jgi:hypothetical protein
MNITYKINKSVVDLQTITTRQIRQLVECLIPHMGKSLDSDKLSKILTGKIETRQDPTLIFRYYQRDLQTIGILSIDKVKAEPKRPAKPTPHNVTDVLGQVW